MNEQPQTSRQQRTKGALLLEFLGSMYLAIILLVVIAIASAIGTVLQQNQPYADYVRKFGPFWFDVFRTLGFYDVYSATWFLLLVGFMLLSTAVCVWRNTPAILREFRHFRLDVQEKSLRAFHHVSDWTSDSDRHEAATRIATLLQQRGYKVRSKTADDHLLIAATRGATGRLGYIAFHVSIIVICVAGLINGNLPLRFAELTGKVKVETRDLPVSQVPPESQLGTGNLAFRGSVNIPEGSYANFAFLQVRDGYLVQNLPFKITLEDFRIEHYPSGQPKSFESDIIITDDGLKEPIRKTIAVNHPVSYKGYNIYQASFADGGSHIELKAWLFDAPTTPALPIEAVVGDKSTVETSRGPLTIEVSDFKLYNIFPLPENDPSGKKFHNYGPSVILRVRNAAGEALEYVNYMVPIIVEGRSFYLSGMRASTAEEYRFLHLPLDSKGGLDRFMALRSRALDSDAVRRIAKSQTLREVGAASDDKMAQELIDSIAGLVQMFVTEGIDAVVKHTEQNIEPAKRQEALQSYVKVIQSVIGGLYLEQLAAEGIDTSKGVSEADAHYFDGAINAMSLIGPYGSPFYLQLSDFKHVEASGLQITRAPGTPLFVFGSLMLIAGVFLMLYLHHRHLWVRISGEGEKTQLLFAGMSHRNRGDFELEFDLLAQQLRQATLGQNP